MPLNVRVPAAVKQRLEYHARKAGHKNASKLARHAVVTLVRILDQQEEKTT